MNQNAPVGTKKSGYDAHGPYSCGNCVHQTNGFCQHPDVIADPELKTLRSKQGVQIDTQRGCCTYVRPSADAGTILLQHLTRTR